jgi:hypothetical protein
LKFISLQVPPRVHCRLHIPVVGPEAYRVGAFHLWPWEKFKP